MLGLVSERAAGRLVLISHPQLGWFQAHGRDCRDPSLEQPFEGILTRGGMSTLSENFFIFFQEARREVREEARRRVGR
jgi:hypothetical protein